MESDKLNVVVAVDLDCNTARIKVKGHVNDRNLQALLSVARRANALTAGLTIVVDLSRASATSEALGQLTGCARARMLPAGLGTEGIECALRIVQPSRAAAPAPADVALAA